MWWPLSRIVMRTAPGVVFLVIGVIYVGRGNDLLDYVSLAGGVLLVAHWSYKTGCEVRERKAERAASISN